MTTRISKIEIELIFPNPYQPRQRVDSDAIGTLAKSIADKRVTLPETMGLLQIPIARKVTDTSYQLAFGHRRLAAFQLNYRNLGADWAKMPLHITRLSDEDMYAFAASENGDRVEVDAIERARSILLAKERFGWTLERASIAHGLSKGAGSNLTRLLLLPEELQELIATGSLGQQHGRQLLRLMQIDPPLLEQCVELGRNCVDGNFSVAELSTLVDNWIAQVEARQRFEAQVRGTRCYKCDGFLKPDERGGSNFLCETCGLSWWGPSHFDREKRVFEQGNRLPPTNETTVTALPLLPDASQPPAPHQVFPENPPGVAQGGVFPENFNYKVYDNDDYRCPRCGQKVIILKRQEETSVITVHTICLVCHLDVQYQSKPDTAGLEISYVYEHTARLDLYMDALRRIYFFRGDMWKLQEWLNSGRG